MMHLKKSMGQHFLNDKNILAKEVRLLNVKDKIVLEIGAGDGRLTEQLLLAGAKKVIAVEKDKKLGAILQNNFAGKNVEIIIKDFLEIRPDFIFEKIIGNIPYYISSQILFKLKEFDFKDALLMVQDEFAKKMVAKPNDKNYGRLSVTSQLFYKIKYVQKIPSSVFIPIPRVNSAIILLKKKNVKITKNTENIIRVLFQHKNKTVRNALLDGCFEKEMIQSLGKLLKMRPRQLEQKKILEIAELLCHSKPRN